jgi:hypothetical protein
VVHGLIQLQQHKMDPQIAAEADQAAEERKAATVDQESLFLNMQTALEI